MPSIEDAKRAAAREAVANHYPQSPKFVGIGSGTTIVYVVEAIKALGVDTSSTSFVPTGFQSNQLIVNAGLTPVAFDALPEGAILDVAFDGADEVDDDLNCIKGGGAYYRKLQSRLLTAWPSVPIEVAPLASRRVITALKALGSPAPQLRHSLVQREGPIKTDQSFFIVDAPFPQLLTASDIASGKADAATDAQWEVEALAREIKQIPGVLEVGLFCGLTGPQAQAAGGVGGQKPIAAYFGMADGSVQSRKAKSMPEIVAAKS
ncbi:ribose 5-phosphate isomerase A [Uncinocarpus reesii 1704]|uniref:Ribose-5-phosphate isomerase n=1 Tax=Uncinocarpus reesii (strain UAMH 1704) TaxID=336963 RepID=C4JQF8_UNCRE|nr:ribose 5-phosphate isomerase A [Uncinocarpus reesii 1704]EEP79866.1 ribose 5-phosphate isomerase A [Uncinocarpus reesii 1704]